MVRIAYSILLYLLVPLVLLRLWLKGRVSPAYRKRIPERFALGAALGSRATGVRTIWVHSVSVGETIAAAPLVRQLLKQYPEHTVLVTTTTPTGSAQVKRLFGDSVEHVYFPYDLPDAVARFLNRSAPEIILLLETEIWPNLYSAATKRKIPLLLVNARLSEKSFIKYRKLPALVNPTLDRLSAIVAQSGEDAQRFISLGAHPEQVKVAGNIKFDVSVPEEILLDGKELRATIGEARPVWVGASTHVGEDEQLLAAHRRLLQTDPDALLVLVPRHPERFEKVGLLCAQHGYSLQHRSHGGAIAPDTQVLLGDTMGELMLFYSLADIAFVGGSLVDAGGHNPLEPASLGLPIISGQGVYNFLDVYAQLESADAVELVANSEELAQALEAWQENEKVFREKGRRALGVVTANKGGVESIMAEVEKHLA